MKLNEYQRAAVLDESDACIVNAKVGSGKTTVLISKVQYLHEVKHVPYEEMIVLTFTNKAAQEIKERLLAITADQTESGIAAEQLKGFGTFHSVALCLLREKLPIQELGYEPEFAVITPEEETELALELIKEQKLKIKYKNRLKKRLEQEREDYENGREEPRYHDALFVLMRMLGQEKLKRNQFTFRDLIRVSNYLLRKNLQLKQDIDFHPKWVIVDEVQDCDAIQIEFLTQMKNYGAAFFAVGDPNQVIYSWRGSSSRIFYQLKERFHARELSLPLNYRSSNVILAAAKCFQQNADNLAGTRENGELIVVKNHYNAFQEANELVAEIQNLNQRGVSYHEIAVFYRLQSQSEILEKVFAAEGIPFEVSVKKTVQDIPILNWFLKKMKRDCQNKGLFDEAPWRGAENRCSDTGAIETPDMSAQDIYDFLNIDEHLKPNAAGYQEEKEQILEMLDRMRDYTNEQHLTLIDGFRQFLNSSALYGIRILQKEVDMTEDSVKLMTLHASKGLEFSHVFIIGVNYGLIPLRTQEFEEEDEERRLFFVGMTRAKDYLELSYYTNPDQPRVTEGPSRYIQMIPQNLIRDESRSEPTGAFTANGKVDLQKMRKEVEKSSAMQTLAVLFGQPGTPDSDHTNTDEKVQKVRHEKYGVGIIISEDENMVEAEFENYGVKQFMKMFSELERI
ncbi:MAG: ATP-dependent helicase [Hespellia sp.]|nr:ATP-dependent helicase [Hespellia sp.]